MTRTPKKKNVEETWEPVQVTNGKDKKKKYVKVKEPAFEFGEYDFAETPIDSTSQFKNRSELFDKYNDVKEVTLDEALKLYAKFGKIFGKDVSLVTVKDHTQNTLNLVITTKNKVVEMKMSLEYIPILDMIHLHKQAGDIIYTNLLKATLKVSRLQSIKSKIENHLRQEKVENKSHQQQIKKLQTDLLSTDS